MVRLIMTSDTHTMHRQLKMPEAQPGDIFIHAGDFSYMGKDVELISFNDWLDELEYDHLIVIPGNHELSFETRPELAKRLVCAPTILNQESVIVEGLHIYGEPRQPEFFNWAFNVCRSRMYMVWDQVPENVDILVTHGPPYGVGDTNSKGEHCGCHYLTEWIERVQPKLVVCGHIHAGAGIYKIGNTTVVNASACNDSYKVVNQPVVLEWSDIK